MYARVTMFQTQPGKINVGIQIYHESVVPAAKQLQGFKDSLLLTDQSLNKGYVITMWETEADMLAGEANGYYQAVLGKIASIITTPPVWGAYEVTG